MENLHKNIIEKLDYFYEKNQIPHIIFYGSSGSGKKTLVYKFIGKIYDNDKQKMKNNVMFVNCSHGKGIKFIRDELKFFAKTNLQSNNGVKFKSIVLFNADSLTNDAQSALRRCIEIFSYNTRFFIIVENKHKLLNPILSRFCEIYVPEYIPEMSETNKIGASNHPVIENLHQYHLKKKFNTINMDNEKQKWFCTMLNDIQTHFTTVGHNKQNKIDECSHDFLLNICTSIYENGYSCLDLMYFVNRSTFWTEFHKSNILMCFHKIKSEFRCEKLLLFYMLDFIYLREDVNIENIFFI